MTHPDICDGTDLIVNRRGRPRLGVKLARQVYRRGPSHRTVSLRHRAHSRSRSSAIQLHHWGLGGMTGSLRYRLVDGTESLSRVFNVLLAPSASLRLLRRKQRSVASIRLTAALANRRFRFSSSATHISYLDGLGWAPHWSARCKTGERAHSGVGPLVLHTRVPSRRWAAPVTGRYRTESIHRTRLRRRPARRD